MSSTVITGGEINLKSSKTPASFGILLGKGKDLTIDGGNITIDGFKWGIDGGNSKIYFNGGTTTIKNSTMHTIWIVPAADPENDIVFGDGMGIKGDTYVFYDDESTGIADSGNVVITEGYTYRKHYGWETIGGDSNSGDESESSIKVPNTGIFSGENGGAIIMAISMGALAAVAGGAYVASYAIRRRSVRAKFLKK